MAVVLADARDVPRFDINGEQHPRRPFQDKTQLFTTNIDHPRWLQPPPAIKTRSELMQARKLARVPHSSYDFDGDGVVSSIDYLIGRSFDKDCDGRLSTSERKQAEQALQNGFLDRYHGGYDATSPAHRNGVVQQRRGVIITSDNVAEVANTMYPPHFNAHKFPAHATKTALELSRLAEAKGAGAEVGERHADSLKMVPEPLPPDSISHPRTCEISNIRERALADHQAARSRAGLLAMPTAVNPDREERTRGIGLDYVEQPAVATQGQLMATRREAKLRYCEEQRAYGEANVVPPAVRKAIKQERQHELNKVAATQAMTLSKLKDQRRRDKVEYDMSHFELPRAIPREYPRFSDNPDVPFWATGGSGYEQATSNAANTLARSVSEPAFKVTDVPFGEKLGPGSEALPGGEAAGHPASASVDYKDWSATEKDPLMFVGSKTKKRFTAEMLDRGQGRNQPRFFDRIQPIRVSPKDLEDLDVTSSMETIRKKAIRHRNETNQKNAELPRTSALARKDTADSRQSTGGVARGHRLSTLKDVRPMYFDSPGDDRRMTLQDQRPIRVFPADSTRKRRTLAQASISAPHLMRNAGGGLDMGESAAMGEPKFFGTTRKGGGIRSGGFQHVDWPVASTLAKPSSASRPRSRS